MHRDPTQASYFNHRWADGANPYFSQKEVNTNGMYLNIKYYNFFIGYPVSRGYRNTLTASLPRGKTPSKNVLFMTLNNLMVRFQ